MRLRRAALPALLGAVAFLGSMLPGAIGALCLWPALGVAPGMVLARALAGREPRGVRWLVALTLSPVVSSVAGWALLQAAVPIRAAALGIAVAAMLAWVLLEALAPDPEPMPDSLPEPRAVRGIAFALGAAVALCSIVNPFMLLYADGWAHAAIAWEILTRGIPPQDPRFAGITLHYVWFFNLDLALLTAIRGQDPFLFMLIVNAVNAALCVRIVGRIGARLGRSAAAATGAALLLVIGLNAGAWVLWPLRLLGALHGAVRGMAEVHRILRTTWIGDARVIHTLSAPYSLMVSFLDKFLLGTGLNTAWAIALLYLWAMVDWFATGARSRLLWAAVAIAGLFLIHLVPGMAVVPVTLGTLALAVLLRRRVPWLPPAGSLVAFGAATLAGLLPVVPYALWVMLGWKPETSGLRISYLRLSPIMPWTLLTSCGVAFLFAFRALRRVPAERRPERGMLALWLPVMALFASLVHLTEDNESKFVFLTFLPIALFGGPELLAWLREGFARHRARTLAIVLLVFAVPPVATLAGYLHDPRIAIREDAHPRPGERRLYDWIRDSTEVHAVFADPRWRDQIMVRGRRRLLYGSEFGPERAAFPLREVEIRRAVLADLYGRGAELDRDAREVAAHGGPGYVVVRPAEPESVAAGNLERRPDRFRRVYDRDGFRVYRVIQP